MTNSATTPKPSARKKRSPVRRRPSASRASSWEAILRQMAAGASAAGTRVGALSRTGAQGARRAVHTAGAASRKAVAELSREWKKMDTARKVEFVAALLGALAAISAPLVRRRKKK